MDIVEQVMLFVSDAAFLALVAATILGAVLGWGLAAILCRISDFGARGCFSSEVSGYRAWGVAFILHAAGIVILGTIFFLVFGSPMSLIIPYIIVVILDFFLCVMLYGRAERLGRVSR